MGRVVSSPCQEVVTAYTRPTRLEDIPVVADTMRAEDIAEVKAQSGNTPRQALLFCFFASKPCMTMVSRHGHLMGMWGVVPEGEMSGRIWMLGSQAMLDDVSDRRVFLRESIKVLSRLHGQYPVLFNQVDARNKVHVRWLQWMGFTFIQEHPNYGAEGRQFLEFCRMSSHV